MKQFFYKNKEKILISIIILLFIAILAPMLYTAKYIHSYADDYMYGIETHHTWMETHSILKVLKVAIQKTINTYNTWQGSFAAVFLMALQPAVFGEQYYFLSTIILIGAFILSNLYIMKIILKDYLNANKLQYILITLILITISIQFVAPAHETFYWYNGAIYYTFFYSIMLFFIGTILKIFKTEEKKKKNVYLIVCIILAVLLGGSNYTTALIINIILGIMCFFSIIKKDKNLLYIGILFVVCFTSFMISVKAPGNSMRQATETNNMAAFDAIKESFRCGYIFTKKWNNVLTICFYLLLIVILTKITKNTDIKFRMPLLFTIVTICIYAAQFTPPLYAMGVFPPRLINIIFYSQFWLIGGNLCYWIGYLNKKNDIKVEDKSYTAIIAIIIFIGVIITIKNYKKTNTYLALENFRTGVIYQYDKEMNERQKLYQDEDIKDVEVKALTVRPYLINPADIGEDTEQWGNKAVADFYGKDSVKIVKEISSNYYFTKYSNNPVLGNEKTGVLFDPYVIYINNEFYMYVSNRSKKAIEVYKSSDGINWQDGQVVLENNLNSGWEEDVNRCCIIYQDGKYKMWYTGQANKMSNIGYAESEDPYNFKRIQQRPVLIHEGKYEKDAVMNPYVIYDKETKMYKMWYAAGENYEPDVIAYAESKDGLQWEKYERNPIYTASHIDGQYDSYKVGGCEVKHINDFYYMFYIGYTDINTACIMCAKSSNGITDWEKISEKPLIISSDYGFDKDACYKPTIYYDVKNDKISIWYNGRNESNEYIGLAYCNGKDILK